MVSYPTLMHQRHSQTCHRVLPKLGSAWGNLWAPDTRLRSLSASSCTGEALIILLTYDAPLYMDQHPDLHTTWKQGSLGRDAPWSAHRCSPEMNPRKLMHGCCLCLLRSHRCHPCICDSLKFCLEQCNVGVRRQTEVNERNLMLGCSLLLLYLDYH